MDKTGTYYSQVHGAFVQKKTGKAMRGLTKACDFKVTPRVSSERAQEGMRSGLQLDRELTSHINKKTALSSDRAKAMMAALVARGLKPVAAQVAVCNVRKRIATAIDMLWTTVATEDSPAVPVLVELKYTGMQASSFEVVANRVDAKLGPIQSVTDGHSIPRTLLNQYRQQLRCTAQLYARSKKMKKNTVLNCILAISTSSGPLLYDEHIVYVPNTGINKAQARSPTAGNSTPRTPVFCSHKKAKIPRKKSAVTAPAIKKEAPTKKLKRLS